MPPRYPPPPADFRPAQGVEMAVFARPPAFILNKRESSRGSKAAGRRYERKAQRHFLSFYPDFYIPGPWIKFWARNMTVRWCQPDGILLDVKAGRATIIEMKLAHTCDAWYQLRHLYEPVVRALLPSRYELSCVEVCRWYDPAIILPEKPKFLPAVEYSKPGQYGVHIWRTD